MKGLDGRLHITVRGDNYYLGIRIDFLNSSQYLDAVNTGHLYIREDQGGPFLHKNIYPFFTILGGQHLITFVGQGDLKQTPDTLLIVNNQNLSHSPNPRFSRPRRQEELS